MTKKWPIRGLVHWGDETLNVVVPAPLLYLDAVSWAKNRAEVIKCEFSKCLSNSKKIEYGRQIECIENWIINQEEPVPSSVHEMLNLRTQYPVVLDTISKTKEYLLKVIKDSPLDTNHDENIPEFFLYIEGDVIELWLSGVCTRLMPPYSGSLITCKYVSEKEMAKVIFDKYVTI